MSTSTSGTRLAITLIAGAVLGFLLIGATRFATQEHLHGVHYHANWAIFVNGERLDLTDTRYMEDILVCTADPSRQNPEERVHMHENNQDVVHVHASGVAWGHLMANLGFAFSDDYLYTDKARFENDSENTLKFVLNGMAVQSLNNRMIGDRDRLVISYGPESVDEVLEKQFPLVETSAARYNEMPDPASCSGAVEETMGDRLRRAFWF